MSTDRNNETDGQFDIEKESKIVANLIVGELIDAKIVKENEAERAVEIAAEEILVRRSMESLKS